MNVWLIVVAVGMVIAGFLTAVGVLALMIDSGAPEKGVLSDEVYREEFGETEDA